ncbi:inactive serine/threonine-protein kinase PLK5 [Manis pentadactyla]|uniref:inactive serine/threonine-protein kinase PLK5 n=1 Tax=Manis pentadactyla TaxID=143292 RepID=UPI00255CA308|nr:inactive serine/threonine-protein kinase PLK5 [Manis pentadactyla]
MALGALCGVGGLRIQAVGRLQLLLQADRQPTSAVCPEGGASWRKWGGPLHPREKVECKIALHSRLRHRNIVAFYRHFADHVYVVVEFCSRQVTSS